MRFFLLVISTTTGGAVSAVDAAARARGGDVVDVTFLPTDVPPLNVLLLRRFGHLKIRKIRKTNLSIDVLMTNHSLGW